VSTAKKPTAQRVVVATEALTHTRMTMRGRDVVRARITQVYELTLDCGHRLIRPRPFSRAKCERGCVSAAAPVSP